MSRAEAAERAFEREEDALADALDRGEITRDEYNRNMRELRRDLQGAYEEDRQDALGAVDAEWGRNW